MALGSQWDAGQKRHFELSPPEKDRDGGCLSRDMLSIREKVNPSRQGVSFFRGAAGASLVVSSVAARARTL